MYDQKYQLEYKRKNKTKLKKYNDKYREKNRQVLLKKKREKRWKNRDEDLKRKRKYWKNLPKKQKDQIKEKHRQYWIILKKEQRMEVIHHYCKGKPCCMCKGCQLGKGKIDVRFLTIEHKNGRKNKKTGHALVREIIKLNFPKAITIFCWNCNCAKGHYGVCPHRE